MAQTLPYHDFLKEALYGRNQHPFALVECMEWLLTRLILLRSLNCDTFRTFTATLMP